MASQEDMQKILEDIGLSQNEALVYLALNELGSATATKIAEKSKVHRTNIYDSINRLIERGLVSFFIKDGTKYFETTQPDNLLNLLKMKEVEVINILPQLKLREKLSQHEENAVILKGTKAFMNVLYDFLKYKEPIYVFGIPKVAPEMIETQISHFHKERIKRKIEMDVIYNFDAQERLKEVNELKYTEARFIDDKFKSLVSTNICGEEVVLSLWVKPVFIVRIKNKDIAEAYRHYFKLLWKEAIA